MGGRGMKSLWDPEVLSASAVLITCSSHEERCRAIVEGWKGWRPELVALFRYDDPNPRREENHQWLVEKYRESSEVLEVGFSEGRPTESFWEKEDTLKRIASLAGCRRVYLDISVFTKRHLLLLLQWLNDQGVLPALIYAEPEDYDVSEHIPLSFGLSRVEEVPGFAAAPDASRPLEATIFLGYEGERALATYELLQPFKTVLVVPEPAFRKRWEGRSDHFNRHLIATVGESCRFGADGIDPEATVTLLREVLGPESRRSSFYRVLCPLGTKPQAVGAYLYARRAIDPPAILYSSPLRHNHDFFSHGVHRVWSLEIQSW